MLGHYRDRRTDRITGPAKIIHEGFKFGDYVRICCEEGVGAHCIPRLERNFHRSKPAEVAADDDAMLLGKPLPCDGRCRDAHRRFTRGGSPPAAMVADAVLLPIGIVSMSGAERVNEIAVVSAPRIFVPNEQRNGSPGRFPFKHTGENLNRIGFLPLCDVSGGPRLVAIQIFLNVVHREIHSWRTAIYHTANRRPMAFAEGGDREDSSKRIASHGYEVRLFTPTSRA